MKHNILMIEEFEELNENKSPFNIDNESETVRIIKEISPSNIKKYQKNQLISLMNKEKDFFYYIDINSLKLFDNEVIESLSEKKFSDLTRENLEKLASAEKIQYLNDNFLNKINSSLLPGLSKNFFNQISSRQFEATKKKVIMNLVKCRKIEHLNKSNIQQFYKKYFNSIKEIKDIKYLLSKSGKKFEYLTADNFIYLGQFIGKTEELDYFFEKLRKYHFQDEESNINTNFQKPIFNRKDLVNDDTMVIKHEEIRERINNFLTDGESYTLLKEYCIKCYEKEEDRELSIIVLNEILNSSTHNIFQKIDHYKILEILIIIDAEEKRLNYYIRLIKTILEINNLILFDPCEFDAKISLFSEIINERTFNIDFLEILAEENLRNIKYLINNFFSGTDKTAIPENLRNQHVKIIKDYLEIVKRKYKINEDDFIKKLQKITEDTDKDNLEIKLNLFLKTITIPEKLYYDLMIQSVMEMPSFEKYIESKANTFFKFIRDIGIAVLGAKCASMTGSKVLTSISIGIGVAKILKNIKDEVMKSYFSLSDNQKKLYLINYRSTPQSTGAIIAKKIKERYRKIITPIKRITNNFIRNKILKIKNEAKVGFDKANFDFKDTEKLMEECITFRNNNIDSYFDNKYSIIEPLYIQNLYNIKEKINKLCLKNQSKKLNEFSIVKEKLIKYLVNKRKNQLNKKYPEYCDSFFNNTKKKFYKVKDFFVGTFNGLISSVTFNFVDLRIKENRSKILEKLIYGVKETNYQDELEKLKEYEKNCAISSIKDEIKYYLKTSNDENIFNVLEIEKISYRKKLERLKNILKSNVINNNMENNLIDVISQSQENNINDISISTNEYYDEKNEPLIILKEY